MIIVSKFRLFIFLLITLAAFVLIGAASVYFLRYYPADGQHDFQVRSEIIIIAVIIFASIITGVTVLLLRSGKDAIKTLRRIIYKYQQLSVDIGDVDDSIGRTGKELLDLYRTLIEYNRKRTIKINSLSMLARFLLNMQKKAAAVTDSAGHVVYRNAKFPITRDRTGLIKLHDIFPEVDFPDLVRKTFETGAAVEVKLGDDVFAAVPIFAMHDSLAYILFTADKSVFTMDYHVTEKVFRMKKKSFSSKLKDLFFGK